jgi:hypothetical protein
MKVFLWSADYSFFLSKKFGNKMCWYKRRYQIDGTFLVHCITFISYAQNWKDK